MHRLLSLIALPLKGAERLLFFYTPEEVTSPVNLYEINDLARSLYANWHFASTWSERVREGQASAKTPSKH